MKIPIWESEWLGINFSEISRLNFFKRPSSNFYADFYQKVFDKYASPEDLPQAWRVTKKASANALSDFLPYNCRVLSIGAGLGFIEIFLSSHREDLEVSYFDWASSADKWLRTYPGVHKAELGDGRKKYDVIYMCQLTYALTDNELVSLLADVRNRISDDGLVISIDTSLLASERSSEDSCIVKNIFAVLKRLIAPVYYIFKSPKKYQFWGWSRSGYQLEILFRSAGFDAVGSEIRSGELFKIFTPIKST